MNVEDQAAGQASAWRREIAAAFGRAYDDVAEVRAVLISGSAATGRADSASDIEMTVFWDVAPTDAMRRDIIERGGGEARRLYDYEEENGDWPDDAALRGVELQISNRPIAVVEAWLADVVDRYDTSLVKQDLIAIIQSGVPLKGAAAVDAWRAQVATYPPDLARAMVAEHLWFVAAWNRSKLANRGEVVLFYEDAAASAKRLFLVWLALSGVYLPHLGFKWMEQAIRALPIAPTDAARRLRFVFEAPLVDGALALNDLIAETFDLVARELPDVDIAEARADFFRQRATWDAPP
ncbi:MAG: DUF4037 domain-containing protein [Anaerolineae bacterium]